MSKPRVLISDKLSPAAVSLFENRGVEPVVKTGLSPDELAAIIGDFDGLAIRSATKVTADLLAKAGRLKVVGRAGIGVDNVDVSAATARGVVVMNTPFGNAITTAEHAIAMMMALARQIPAADASTRAGKWEKSRFMGTELYGKTLGVIGCGNIGAIVADRALGLHMRVVAFDPYLSDERARDLGVHKVSLEELLPQADIITLHTPLTPQTRGILDQAALAKTKPGVRIVNCARGGLVVEQDLYDAIVAGHVAGAALDVFEEEPAKVNPLFALEHVVVTPHLGASTAEAQENVAVQVAEQMAAYLVDGAVSNALNMPSVSAEDAPRLRPYMALCDQLGRLAGQVSRTAVTGVRVSFCGPAAALNGKPLMSVVLAALLGPRMDSVNMVNAPVIARERGIDVEDARNDDAGAYQTLVRLEVTTETQTRVLEGTLFADKPRLVALDDVAVEAELGPHMLYVRNDDAPGFIGVLGTVLGDAGVNIATFHLGRSAPGETAVALVQVDQPVAAAVLRQIEALPQVRQVQSLSF